MSAKLYRKNGFQLVSLVQVSSEFSIDMEKLESIWFQVPPVAMGPAGLLWNRDKLLCWLRQAGAIE